MTEVCLLKMEFAKVFVQKLDIVETEKLTKAVLTVRGVKKVCGLRKIQYS